LSNHFGEAKMNIAEADIRRDLTRYRRLLPVAAYPRPALLATLRSKGVIGRSSPRLSIVDMFDAGEPFGLLCRFSAIDVGGREFVAPIRQVSIAFDRSAPPNRRLNSVAHYGKS
jgi:hypothetical protein